MDVYWLEQTEADVPQGEDWLSPIEAGTLRTMRFPKRRADWLLGRWTAKNAFAICFGYPIELPPLRDIEIHAAPSGAPEIYYRREPSAATISISHRVGVAACAVAPSRALLGCDIEIIEARGDTFAADYFTLEEQVLFEKAEIADRLRLVTLFWSGKESALKALREGLRLDTRSLTVSLSAALENPFAEERSASRSSSVSCGSSSGGYNNWNPFEVRHGESQIFHGWWSQSDSLLRTVLGAPSPDVPILLVQQRCVPFVEGNDPERNASPS
jgi:4'-phosphopantetheinyl transferase